MNREIKFRAWLKPRWDNDDESNKMYYDVQNSHDTLGDVKPDYPMDDFKEWLEEDAAIVEQYTGLKDEDGKEIYEGDIVTLNCYWEEVDPRDCFAIKFEDGCFRVGDGFENEAGKYLKEYRLAGNIHENPELLGE